MRHQKSGRRFNRDTDARKALMRNLCTSLLEHNRVTTTEARAKELRRWVERLITAAQAQDVNARRRGGEGVSEPRGGGGPFSHLLPPPPAAPRRAAWQRSTRDCLRTWRCCRLRRCRMISTPATPPAGAGTDIDISTGPPGLLSSEGAAGTYGSASTSPRCPRRPGP